LWNINQQTPVAKFVVMIPAIKMESKDAWNKDPGCPPGN
jgi:hypothetical protein